MGALPPALTGLPQDILTKKKLGAGWRFWESSSR